VYSYEREVHVYETDLMGIVHHSNYLRFCEEARVDWCKRKGLLLNKKDSTAQEQAVYGLTVYETRVKHINPIRYSDRIVIHVQVRVEGVRMIFQYKILVNQVLKSVVETIHCNLDLNFKVKRLSPELINLVEKEIWTETWL
jgi:acyl-CoA thioester hydrolase